MTLSELDSNPQGALKPIKRSSSVDVVYRSLKAAILDNRLKQEEQLKVEFLAEQFDISPTPIREALARLEQDYLVYTIPYKGAFVSKLTPQDIREVLAVRAVLEGWATEQAALRISTETLKELEEMSASVAQEVSRGRYLKHYESDIEFHAVIVESANNKWLTRVLSTLNNQVDRIRSLSSIIGSGSHVKESLAEHFAILNALKERDGPKARSLMEQHLERAGNRIAEILAELHGELSDQDTVQ